MSVPYALYFYRQFNSKFAPRHHLYYNVLQCRMWLFFVILKNTILQFSESNADHNENVLQKIFLCETLLLWCNVFVRCEGSVWSCMDLYPLSHLTRSIGVDELVVDVLGFGWQFRCGWVLVFFARQPELQVLLAELRTQEPAESLNAHWRQINRGDATVCFYISLHLWEHLTFAVK